MRRRLSTRLYRYEPRLLSRSTTILKPSSKTCCSIVSRTFDGAIGPSASFFGVRFRVEGVSARTGAILIRDRNLLRQCGQRHARILRAVFDILPNANLLLEPCAPQPRTVLK